LAGCAEVDASFGNVYFAGSHIEEFEKSEVLFADLSLARFAFGVILFFLLLSTKSAVRSVAGIVIVSSSIPIGYVCFAALASELPVKVSIINGVAFFFVLDVGVGNIFVFNDSFRQASADADERVASTYGFAGKACTVTTFATGMSFMANVMSPIPALREFGYFMAVCIFGALVQTLLLYPSVMHFHESLIERVWRAKDDPYVGGSAQGSDDSEVRLSGPLDKLLFNVVGTAVYRFRCVFLFVTLAIAVFAAVVAALTSSFNPMSIQLFPEGHNQLYGLNLAGGFSRGLPGDTGPASPGAVPPEGGTMVCDVESVIEEGSQPAPVCADWDFTCGRFAVRGLCGGAPSDAASLCPAQCGLCERCLFHVCQREENAVRDPDECACTVEPVCSPNGWQSEVELFGVLAVPGEFYSIPLRWLDEVMGRAAFELGFAACEDDHFFSQNSNFCSNERPLLKPVFLAAESAAQLGIQTMIQVNRSVSPAYVLPPLLLQDWLTGDSSSRDLYKLPSARATGLYPATACSGFVRCSCGEYRCKT
jgi:hypothetical protein